MLRLDLVDGTSIGITDHDQELTFNLGDGAITYLARTGILPSDVTLQIGLDSDNYEVTGPISDVVTLPAILGGRFNQARARLFQVNWSDLTQGAIKLISGNVTEARPEGGKFVLEVRSDFDRYNQTVGRTITNSCSADFGDSQCKATPTEVTGTVTAVTDIFKLTLSFAGTFADNYFKFGTLVPLTGANAGCQPVEILSWTSAGAVEIFAPLPSLPEIGDTFNIRNGCSKLRTATDPTLPTCLGYDNVVNFRGYPEVPGSDQVLRATVPGEADL